MTKQKRAISLDRPAAESESPAESDIFEVLEFRDQNLEDGDQSDVVVVDSKGLLLGKTLREEKSGEEILWLMAFVTPKHAEDLNHDGVLNMDEVVGDRKLASMTRSLFRAGLHTHTFDAQSGAPKRITRIGATRARLNNYASAVGYIDEFDPAKVEAECQRNDLILKNPDLKLRPEARTWYHPYDKLSGPYSAKHAHLFRPFTNGDFLYLLNEVLQAPEKQEGIAAGDQAEHPGRGCGWDLDRLDNATDGDNAAVEGLFCLHDEEGVKSLHKKLSASIWPWNMPTNDMSEYFGKEIAFYFAFLSTLTSGFMMLAGLALLAQVMAYVGYYPEVCVLFALLGVCAYGAILDAWRMEQSKVCHLWGCLDGFEANITPRKANTNESIVIHNPATGKLDIEYPPSKRARSNGLSMLVTYTMVVLMLGIVGAIFWWKAQLVNGKKEAPFWLLLMPSLANAAQISVLATVYQIIAEALTDIENHKTVADHNSELFRKLTFFYFINYNAALFYIAFLKKSVEGECYDPLTGLKDCGRELGTQTLIVYLSNDFGWRMCTSVILPPLINYVKGKLNDLDEEKMDDVELVFEVKTKYDPTASLVLDYIELFVQWSYLTLFGASFPALVCLAAVTNLIECRTDCTKLLNEFRRVTPRRVNGIGEATGIFYMTLYAAVFCNAGLVVYTFEYADEWISKSGRPYIWFVVTLFLFFMLQQMTLVFPEMPKKTEIQMQRQAFIHSNIIHGIDPMPDEYGETSVRMERDIGTRRMRGASEDFSRLYDQEEELKRHDKKGVRTIDLYDISVTPTDITSKFSLQAGSM
jgi:hypothetical protein